MPEIFGKQVSKGTVYAGIGIAGLLGIAVYRYQKQQKAAAAVAAANAAAQAPGTGAGSSDQIDPATGFPYGSAQDAAALTAQSGYNSPLTGGYGDYGYGGVNSYPVTSPASFTSNAQWAQAAEQYMVGNGGDANAIGNALGKYITGQPLGGDDTSQQLINQAIAFEGYPPVPGPNGFPPSVNTANSGSTGSTGTTQPSGTAVIQSLPNAGGTSWEQVSFPNQAAWDAWTAWNQNFAATHNGRTQAYRSEWNTELASLGATGVNGPLTPPNPNSPNPYDRQ